MVILSPYKALKIPQDRKIPNDKQKSQDLKDFIQEMHSWSSVLYK